MPPRTKKKLGPLGATIEQLLAARGMLPKLKEYRILGIWASAVGGGIAGHAQPAALRGRKLAVVVDSSAWMQQLTLLKPEIIGKVNAALGEDAVESISLRLGEVAAPAAVRPRPQRTQKPLGPAELRRIEELSSAISDPEVRRSFQHLLEKDLLSKR